MTGLRQVIDRLTEGMEDSKELGDALHASLQGVRQELNDIRDLLAVTLALQQAIAAQPRLRKELEQRRAALFVILAQELPGPHHAPRPVRKEKEAPVPREKNTGSKPETPKQRPVKVKTVAEAEEIIRRVCEAEGFDDPGHIVADWDRFVALGGKYPGLEQAIVLLSKQS